MVFLLLTSVFNTKIVEEVSEYGDSPWTLVGCSGRGGGGGVEHWTLAAVLKEVLAVVLVLVVLEVVAANFNFCCVLPLVFAFGLSIGN